MNVGETLRASAARKPQHTALWSGNGSISYQELDQSTDRIAAWLLKQGLRAGDRLAIHWPNSIEVAKLYFGAFKAGVIAVPVNLRLKPAEITYVFEHSGAVMCFSAPAMAPLAENAAASCSNMRRILTALPSDPPSGNLPEIDPDQPITIIYTSGTTARPKGVVHTHRTFMGCLRGAAESKLLCGGGVSLCMTPMMHVAGLAMMITSVYKGDTAVLATFDAAAVLDAIERHRCTFFFVLPALGQFLLEEQIRKPRDVSSLQIVVAGGDTVNVNMQNRFHEHFGFRLQEGYGLTEGGFLAFNPVDANRLGSMGIALPKVEMRLVDPTDRDVPDGEPGEIIVRSPGSCAGYWNDPAATADLLRGGWLHTGDLGSRDADGYIWFRGRTKQIIVRAGSNISPQEVEEALYQHPAVLEVGVVGKPDPVYGELVVAFVALRQGASVNEDELQAFARERLADYKAPEQIHFLPELPKGLTGKVDRRTLKEKLRPESAVAAIVG
jgi:long-chain acyl-CoA synthetase